MVRLSGGVGDPRPALATSQPGADALGAGLLY
jgi:hypothetical protein